MDARRATLGGRIGGRWRRERAGGDVGRWIDSLLMNPQAVGGQRSEWRAAAIFPSGTGGRSACQATSAPRSESLEPSKIPSSCIVFCALVRGCKVPAGARVICWPSRRRAQPVTSGGAIRREDMAGRHPASPHPHRHDLCFPRVRNHHPGHGPRSRRPISAATSLCNGGPGRDASRQVEKRSIGRHSSHSSAQLETTSCPASSSHD